MAKTEVRVPLNDVQGVPTFLTWENLQQWLKDNKVDVQEDWGGRPSVDIATAWRIKEKADADQARIAADERKRQEFDSKVQAETARLVKLREDKFYELGQSLGIGYVEAERMAWAAVAEEVKKLPKDIAAAIVMPQGMHMQFG